jgi:plasmid replication initiation protein
MSELKIVKDNCLIDNFIFNATELELQILNYAIAITNPYWDKKEWVYKISIPDLVKIYGSKSNNRAWSQYREALLRLQIRTYTYYKGNNKNTIPLIKMVTENIKDNTYLEFRFSSYLEDRIQNLKGLFTQYDIKNIIMFRSRYAFMLYEFFKMKVSQSDGVYSQKISIEDFKTNLDLKNKYSIFRNLKCKVIEIAKKQINKHSDIRINYEIIKTGRTPTYIKFSAKYKKGKSPDELSKNENLENQHLKLKNSKNEFSEIKKSKPLTEEQQKLRKEKWKSVKLKLKI